MKKLTPDFYVHIAEHIKDSVSGNTLDTIHYLALADSQTDWQSALREPDTSVNGTVRDIQKKMIAAKRINPTDICRMIACSFFEPNQVYDMFDDALDMSEKIFFTAVREPSGAFTVWKCLYNNKGLPARVSPTYSSTSAIESSQITSDGYMWKFMYRATSDEARKFTSNGMMPVYENANVKNNAINGSIDVINVDDPGRDYNSYCYGTFSQIQVAGNTLIYSLTTPDNINSVRFAVQNVNGTFSLDPTKPIYVGTETEFVRNGGLTDVWAEAIDFKIRSTNGASFVEILAPIDLNLPGVQQIFQFNTKEEARYLDGGVWRVSSTGAFASADIMTLRYNHSPTLSANTDFYKNSSIYIRSGRGAGQLRTVAEYIVAGNERRVLIDKAFSVVPDINSNFEILPRVIIQGDGTGEDGTGSATAIPVVDNSTNSIISIQMVDHGKNYTHSSVKVIANTGYIDVTTGQPISSNAAKLRPILPPKGGHGANVYSELYSDCICITKDFSNTENGQIEVGNSFSQIVLVKQPHASNTEITLNNSALIFQDEERVEQTDGAARAIVSNRDGNILRLTSVEGSFNTGATVTTVRGGTEATALITDVDRSTEILNCLTRFSVEIEGTGFNGLGFQNNDIVRQGSTEAENANAEGIVFRANSSFISITETKGVWNVSDDISGTVASMINVSNGATAKITGKVDPDLIVGSGTIQHIETISPVTRSAAQAETVRLLICSKDLESD